MDLSNIQPIHKRFNNELELEKYLATLSMSGGKKVDVITIYPKGSYVYVWFYYDRTKIGFTKEVVEGENKADKAIKKTRKKAN